MLAVIALIVTGFTSCAEFGSYAFVHPVLRRLPPEHHILVEQGLLRTLGRVMPVHPSHLLRSQPELNRWYSASPSLGIGGFVHRCADIDNHFQRSGESCNGALERRQSAGEVERDEKPLGILSRLAVLAASDWFRPFVSSRRVLHRKRCWPRPVD